MFSDLALRLQQVQGGFNSSACASCLPQKIHQASYSNVVIKCLLKYDTYGCEEL